MHFLEEKILEDWQLIEEIEHELDNAQSLGIPVEELRLIKDELEQRIYFNISLLEQIEEIRKRIRSNRI